TSRLPTSRSRWCASRDARGADGALLVSTTPTRFRVIHRTRYAYALPVELCHNEAHVKPRTTPWQRCLASRLRIDPAPASVHERVDYFGNPVSYFAVQLPARELLVVATSEVEVTAPDLGD